MASNLDCSIIAELAPYSSVDFTVTKALVEVHRLGNEFGECVASWPNGAKMRSLERILAVRESHVAPGEIHQHLCG